MSRSYKRTPVFKDGSDSRRKRYSKRWANKKVRSAKLIAFTKSNKYRRMYETWDICDYRFYRPLSLEVAKDRGELNWWKKWYYRK